MCINGKSVFTIRLASKGLITIGDLRPIYITENFWHGSGKYGTRSKKIGSARIHFTV